MRAFFIAILLSSALAACTTTGPIAAEDSMVVIDMPASSLPEINRTRSWSGQDLVEQWDWNTGQLYVVRLDRTKYIRRDFGNPEDLIEEADNWPTLARSGTRFDVTDVKTSSNRTGSFIYAISDIDQRGDRCFLMLQGITASGGAGFEPIPIAESSQGYISFYECRPASVTSAEKLKDLMLRFAQAIRHVQR